MSDERDLTPDEMTRAAQFLFGAADHGTVILPPRTARAIARAILGALNVH